MESSDSLRHVLLTGPTGFFGPFLLSSLLRETSCIYHVLIRARNPEHGLARIRDGLRASGLNTPAIEEHLKKRIRVICGDISQYNLGLQSGEWESLATKVQAVIHNAAHVNYVLNYDSLRPHNVDGTAPRDRRYSSGPRKVRFSPITIRGMR